MSTKSSVGIHRSIGLVVNGNRNYGISKRNSNIGSEGQTHRVKRKPTDLGPITKRTEANLEKGTDDVNDNEETRPMN